MRFFKIEPGGLSIYEKMEASNEKMRTFEGLRWKMGVSDEKMGVYDEKMGVYDEKMGVYQEMLTGVSYEVLTGVSFERGTLLVIQWW